MTGLSAEGCAARRSRLREQVDADLLVISNPRHIFYLCNLFQSPLSLGGWGPAFLLIDRETGETELLVHNFPALSAEAAHVDRVTVYPWYDSASDAGVNFWRTSLEALNEALQQRASRRTGIEFGSFPYGAVVGDYVDITETVWRMRRQKDADELRLIRGAVRAIEAGHRAAREAIGPGQRETDVYSAVYEAIVAEAQGPVLPLGDFAAGERAFKGGGPPTANVLKAGDLMILDVFPVVNGYRADFTATVAVDGSLTPDQAALEAALHAAIEAGEATLKPGGRAAGVYRAVRRVLAEHGYAEGFSHHAGHGLGLGHPEAPHFVPGSNEVLLAGDVVTLEPGAYGANFGARIEHNYLITANGFKRLTHHKTTFV